MKESQVIKGWIEEGKIIGMVEAGRDSLLKVLRARFPDPVPESVRAAIEEANDPTTLDRWFHLSLRANSLAEFCAAMPVK
jgi:hypothetical protein